MPALAKGRMLQKVLLVGLLSLLLVGGVVMYFATDEGPGLSAPEQPGGSAESRGEVLAANANGPSDATAATEVDPTSTAARAVAAVFDEATQRPLPDDPNWLEVKVVDKATGSPLAGAVVLWFDETAWQYLTEKDGGDGQQYQELHWQGERLAELAGWRTRSDAQGVARVTAKEWTTVLAQHGTLHGRTMLRGNTVPPVGGHVVELVPDATLTVRVLDDRGAPAADVPITIVAMDKDGEQVSFGWSSIARSRAPDGIATIQHLQILRADLGGNDEAGNRKRDWRVRLYLTGFADPGIAFDIEAPPKDPIELRLPPCGSLRVRAELAGKPVPGFRSAWLSQDHEGERPRLRANRSARVDADGQARFRFVPLAQRYHVGSDVIGGLNGEFAGPIHPGQEVEVVLAPGDDAMLLGGRLLLPDRTPLAEQPIRVRVQGSQLRSQPEVRTGHDGRFLVNLGSPRKDNRVEQLWFEWHHKSEPPRRAEAAPRTLRPGIEELGDLLLGDGAIVVAGRLVAGGKPFPGPISLRVEREEAGDGARPARWRRLDGALEHKDGVGGFTIRGTALPGRYRLLAMSEHMLPVPPIEFVPGATDVVVTVDPGQSLAASLLLPAKAPTEGVSVVLVPAAPPTTDAERQQHTRLKQDLDSARGNRHDVRWPSVPAGTYSLEVRLWAVAKPLVTIPDVVLPAPSGGDARLVDIDLRSLVQVVKFVVRQADGQPVSEVDGMAFPTAQATPNEWVGYQLWSSTPRALLPSGPYDLLVCLSGYRPQPVRGTADTIDVRLDPWPTITVRVAEMPPLPQRARVQVSLQPSERSELRYRTQWSSGDRTEYVAAPRRSVQVVDGKADVPIGDGLYSLRVTVSGNRRSHTLEGSTPQQVLSTAGEVTVTAPKAQWAKAIEVITPPPK